MMMKSFLMLALLAAASAYEMQFPLLGGENSGDGLGIYRKRCHLQEAACGAFCLKTGEVITTYKCDTNTGKIDPCVCSKGSIFTAPAAFVAEIVAAAPNTAPLPPAAPATTTTTSPTPSPSPLTDDQQHNNNNPPQPNNNNCNDPSYQHQNCPSPPPGGVSPSSVSPSPLPVGGATSASAFFAGAVMVAAMMLA